MSLPQDHKKPRLNPPTAQPRKPDETEHDIHSESDLELVETRSIGQYLALAQTGEPIVARISLEDFNVFEEGLSKSTR